MENKELFEKLEKEILTKLHYKTLSYWEDSEKIKSSYTVVKIWFLWQVFSKFLEENLDLFSKYILERKKYIIKQKKILNNKK